MVAVCTFVCIIYIVYIYRYLMYSYIYLMYTILYRESELLEVRSVFTKCIHYIFRILYPDYYKFTLLVPS